MLSRTAKSPFLIAVVAALLLQLTQARPVVRNIQSTHGKSVTPHDNVLGHNSLLL